MPAPSSSKRVRGVQVHRPFIYGTEAIPFDPSSRLSNTPPDHTHRWKVFVRGINDADITHWLRKVQFKLHDTYANSVRMVESPPFEVEETGWGEFEIAIKFYFVAESGEKPQTIWHGLKLHPYGEDVEGKKERREMVRSVLYEEVLFNEPQEGFFEGLTGGPGGGGNRAKMGGKGSGKGGARGWHVDTAEIPERVTPGTGGNVFSREEEAKELDRLGEAVKTVEEMIVEEKRGLVRLDERLGELEGSEGKMSVSTKRR